MWYNLDNLEREKQEKEFYKIRTTLYGKYNKYKKHAGDLETIQRHEEMEEDLKRNEITPEPNENDKEMKELVGKKSEIKEEFEKIKNKTVLIGNYWLINSGVDNRGSSVQFNYNVYIKEEYTTKLDVKPVFTISKYWSILFFMLKLFW